jgi:anhydro-N-acetylmuramic acid kinase
MSEYCIGLMSGTSMDAIDGALCQFDEHRISLVSHASINLPEKIQSTLLSLRNTQTINLNLFGELDQQLGTLFADCANQLIAKSNIDKKNILAIGSHGQTLIHRPNIKHPFTLQIADPNIISEETGITTIADFRRRDIALRGQGAPLVPAFHQAVFSNPKENRVIVNIGGIANLTYLPKNGEVTGFDTGPGNTLMDQWIHKYQNKPMDIDGIWASSTAPDQTLLNLLLSDTYFNQIPPKSTGFEYFNLQWLEQYLSKLPTRLNENTIQATLCELTAISITDQIAQFDCGIDSAFICGGGIYNKHLMTLVNKYSNGYIVESTENQEVHPKWVEAMAFAWLAKQTISGCTSNLRSVTGADKQAILGGIYSGNNCQYHFGLN